MPKSDDELVIPAREGTLRVLRAARDAGVKRVVLTSSFAAIGYGHPPTDRPFSEGDWTDLGGAAAPPPMSSRRRWRNARRGISSGAKPAHRSLPWSIRSRYSVPCSDLIIRHLDRARATHAGRLRCPVAPRLSFGIVDVRDVADLHIRAMTHPAAKGERFLAVAGDSMSMLEIAKVLKSRMGEYAKRVPSREMPNWMVRLVAIKDPAAKQLLPELGKKKNATNEKAKRLLRRRPRSNEEAIIATAESLIRLRLLKDSAKKAA